MPAELPEDADAFHAVLRRRIRDQEAIDAHYATAKLRAPPAKAAATERPHVVGQTGCFCLECLVHRKQEWRVGDVNTAIAGPRDHWKQYTWGDAERRALGAVDAAAAARGPVVTPIVRESVVVRDAKHRALRIQRDAKFTAVASGKYHTLLLSESGGVFACGDNSYGALGQSEHVADNATPLQVDLSALQGRVTQIEASAYASFALVVLPPTDARAKRQSDEARPGSRPAFLRRKSIEDVRGALKPDDIVFNYVVSWGRSHRGVLGHGDTTTLWAPKPIELFNTMRVLHVATGARHVLVLTETHGVFAFGDGSHGKLGLGDTHDRHSPMRIHALDGVHVLNVSAGDDHSIAVTGDTFANRQVYSWGLGDNGRLGHNDEQPRLKPTRINHFRGRKVIAVAAGGSHNLATSEMPDGICVWSWGAGTYGQLGHRETWDAWLPRSIDEIRREAIIFIDAGERHSVAISESRRLWIWGKGIHGKPDVEKPDPSTTCIVQPISVDLAGIQIIGAKAGRGRTYVWGDRAIDKAQPTRAFGGSVAANVCCALPEFESITSDSFRILYRCNGCGFDENTLSRDCSCFSSKKCMFDIERGTDSGSPDTLDD